MKKVTIKNKYSQEFGATMQNPSAWIKECIEKHVWGKPERWVPHKDEPHAQAYDETDVLEERIHVIHQAQEKIPEAWNEQGELVQAEIPELPAITEKQVKLKAEYVIEIVDITDEYELKECLAKRKAAYPSAEEFLNVFFDGGSAELDALKAKRAQIKAKYPKPGRP